MGLRDNDIKGSGSDVRMHGSGPDVPADPAQASISRTDLEVRLKELQAIARSIGLESGLEVELGQPEQGSYCQYGDSVSLRADRVHRRIVIDPLHLLDEGNKFIIAHEGMHAYVTRSAFDRSVYTALKRGSDPEALYSEVGFASLLNYLEDCGGNKWLTTTYPAFEEAEQKLYDPMLRVENPEMHAGETKAIMARLGFYPRFAQFGSEIMKRWHTGSYSNTLDPAVNDALKKQERNNDRFIESFPTTQLATAGELDALFCNRFLIAARQIMPTLRELVEKDKAQAATQHFLNEQKPGENSTSGGGAGAQLSPQTQAEVNQKTAAHRERLRDELQKQLDDLSKRLDGKGSEAQGLQSTPLVKDPSKQIEELRRKIAETFDSPAAEEAKKEANRILDGLEKLKDSIDSQAAPIDKLSDRTQSELQKLYDSLEEGDKQRFKEQGEALLRELEDAIREQLEGKFQETPAPTHKQNSEAKDQATQAAKAYQQMREDAKQLEEVRRSKLSLWDAALEEVSGTVQKLYSRLERVLRPVVPEWDSGHATGSRPNILMTMQAKADRKLVNKMWEQKSLPMEREFVFSLLVDNSGSMLISEKHLHARQCAVLLSEVLLRLKVPFEISIFSDGSRLLKEFDEKPSKEKKNQIGGAMNGQGGGTQDHVAVSKCVKAIGERSEENKFLIVITDGGSNDGTKLNKVLRDALESNVRVIGLGLGSDTMDVDKYYPIGRGGLSLDPKDKEEALGPYFSKLLEAILKNPQQFIAKSLRGKS